MRFKVAMLALFVACVPCAWPGTVFAQAAEGAAPRFWRDHNNYADTFVKPTWWQIDTSGPEGEPLPLAMYRLCLFAKHYKFKYINIVDARRVLFHGDETFWAKGVGSNGPGGVFDCEASGRFVSYCKQYDVDMAIVQLQAVVSATDADTASELANIDIKYPIEHH